MKAAQNTDSSSLPGIVEVVLLDEGYGCLRGLDVLGLVDYLFYFVGGGVDYLVVLADYDVGGKEHRKAHDKSQAHLPYDLGFAAHAVLVVAGDFQIIVGETQGAEPYGGHQHQNHVDIAQFAYKQTGNYGGQDDDDAPHRRGAGLLHLPLQAEVAHDFADLHLLQPVDDLAPEHQGDEQRQDKRRPGAEGYVVHQARSGETGAFEPVEKIVKHIGLLWGWLSNHGGITRRRRVRGQSRRHRNDALCRGFPGNPHVPFRR